MANTFLEDISQCPKSYRLIFNNDSGFWKFRRIETKFENKLEEIFKHVSMKYNMRVDLYKSPQNIAKCDSSDKYISVAALWLRWT